MPRLAVLLAFGLLLTTGDAGAQQPIPTPVTLGSATATPAAIATPAEVDTYTLNLSGATGLTVE